MMPATNIAADLWLVRLLHLASPTLPVGAFSYSQGLEAAVEAGIVRDAGTACAWIADMLALSMCALEAPVLVRLHAAWDARDIGAVGRWNDLLLASRETAELRAETVQMGYSLARLVPALGLGDELEQFDEPAYPTAFAYASARWGIALDAAVLAYIWSWLENQVLGALKALPLGQTAAQRMLIELGARLPDRVRSVIATADAELTNFTPGLALLSSRHETQYSRLFRS